MGNDNIREDLLTNLSIICRKLWDDLYRQTASEYRSVNIKFGRKNGEIYGQFWKNPETREIFDFYILSRRYSLMTMAILMEANHRAAADKKMAYIILDRNSMYAKMFSFSESNNT